MPDKKKNGRRRAAARAFALALRELRERQEKLSQEKVGVHRTYASALERGLHDPSLSTMYKVAPQLRVTVPELTKVIDRHYRPPLPED